MAYCDLDKINSDSKSLAALSQSGKENAFLYYLAKALAGSGGPNYSGINDLRAAINCWCVGGETLDSFKTQVAINAAVFSHGVANFPTVAQVADATKCWNCGIGEQQAMEVFLLCQLLNKLIPPT